MPICVISHKYSANCKSTDHAIDVINKFLYFININNSLFSVYIKRVLILFNKLKGL